MGCRLPHPGVECFIAQLNKLLTNYGCISGLSRYLQTSMELMIVEGSVSTQILSQHFQQYSKWVIHSWLVLVWEKVHMFILCVKIRELSLKFSRDHGGWLMDMLENVGYLVDKLICLNRVQCHQQALFYSDIFDAGGKPLDRQYLTKWPTGLMWSQLIFPQEKPPVTDFC
jgi:hypothetical protein